MCTMKKQKTVYHLILDKSGSMMDSIHQTITGYNEQIQQIRSVQNDYPEQLITVGLTTFNGSVDDHYFAIPVQNAQMMNSDIYRPDGSTSLYDAIGSSVLKLEQMQMSEVREFDTTFVVIVLTDGYENSSRSFRLGEIRRTISRLEATGKWTFSFIGATLDAVEVAEQMNIKRHNSYSYSKEAMGSEVWDKLSTSARAYADRKRKGEDLDDLYNNRP